jgi:outer membrane immunogenic protein
MADKINKGRTGLRSGLFAALMAPAVLVGGAAFAGGPLEPIAEPVVEPVAPVDFDASLDWTGFYAGASLGYGDVDSNGAGLDGNGWLGGVAAGYRRDFGTLVTGVELDYDVTDISVGGAAGELDSVARLKFSAGTEIGSALVYGTLGAARAEATVAGASLSDTGIVGGIGVDYAITDSMVVGGELLEHRFSDFDGSGVDLDATTLKARVLFKF